MIRTSGRRKRVSVKGRLFFSFLVFLLILATYSACPYLPEVTYVAVPETFQFKAAIVDQLSLTYPNQTFVATATKILEQAGFTVDYYKGEDTTVPLYKNLAALGYGLIILRVHVNVGITGLTLMTSELFDIQRYPYQILTDQLASVAYSIEDGAKGIKYFGIRPSFITQSMRGRLKDTLVILMGCSGRTYISMAQAFIQKGAKVYIGWSNLVSASHTDLATAHLLRYFSIQKQTIKQAIDNTMKEVGPDPVYDSQLLHYPLEAESYTLENKAGNGIIGSEEVKHKEFSETKCESAQGDGESRCGVVRVKAYMC